MKSKKLLIGIVMVLVVLTLATTAVEAVQLFGKSGEELGKISVNAFLIAAVIYFLLPYLNQKMETPQGKSAALIIVVIISIIISWNMGGDTFIWKKDVFSGWFDILTDNVKLGIFVGGATVYMWLFTFLKVGGEGAGGWGNKINLVLSILIGYHLAMTGATIASIVRSGQLIAILIFYSNLEKTFPDKKGVAFAISVALVLWIGRIAFPEYAIMGAGIGKFFGIGITGLLFVGGGLAMFAKKAEDKSKMGWIGRRGLEIKKIAEDVVMGIPGLRNIINLKETLKPGEESKTKDNCKELFKKNSDVINRLTAYEGHLKNAENFRDEVFKWVEETGPYSDPKFLYEEMEANRIGTYPEKEEGEKKVKDYTQPPEKKPVKLSDGTTKEVYGWGWVICKEKVNQIQGEIKEIDNQLAKPLTPEEKAEKEGRRNQLQSDREDMRNRVTDEQKRYDELRKDWGKIMKFYKRLFEDIMKERVPFNDYKRTYIVHKKLVDWMGYPLEVDDKGRVLWQVYAKEFETKDAVDKMKNNFNKWRIEKGGMFTRKIDKFSDRDGIEWFDKWIRPWNGWEDDKKKTGHTYNYEFWKWAMEFGTITTKGDESLWVKDTPTEKEQGKGKPWNPETNDPQVVAEKLNPEDPDSDMMYLGVKEIANSLYDEWRKCRDDLRDGRWHRITRLASDYIHSIEKNVMIHPIKDDYKVGHIGSDTSAGGGNPAFDIKSVGTIAPGITKKWWRHTGRRFYHEKLQESGVTRLLQTNPDPAWTSRGFSDFIIALFEKRLNLADAESELKKETLDYATRGVQKPFAGGLEAKEKGKEAGGTPE